MREKVKHFIEANHMFPSGDRIIIGVSGGADSVALLHILNSLKEENHWSLLAVHVHHGLRGKEADEDQAFVEELCKELGVPCRSYRYDVAAEAKKWAMGQEEAGRLLRYDAFRREAGEEGRIAVAHHQRDQAETLLMRLCRGTGLTGLTGMLPVRENICRPLLDCSREEIEAYCLREGLAFREDHTNREECYTRNRLRHRVLPVLEEINPQSVAHMAHTAELLAAEEEYLALAAADWYEKCKSVSSPQEVRLKREMLRSLHPAMRRRVLRQAMAAFLSMDASAAQIQGLEALLEKPTGKSLTFLGGIHGENEYDLLILSKGEKEQTGFCYALPEEGTFFLEELGLCLSLQKRNEKIVEISADICTKVFDYDKIDQTLLCRTRQNGDTISLKGGRKKIKDLFIDEKIPRERRISYPLITAGKDVLWAPGLRASTAYLPDDQTKCWLSIRIRRMQKDEGKS